MRARRLVFALALVLGAAACRGAAAPPPLPGLDAIVQKGLDEQRYPGAVLIVGQGNRRLYARAYGRQTYDPKSPPMRLDTLFDLASISKVAGTTPATMLLLEDGKLGLDDPVAKHLPGFAANGKGGVTVRDLLTHVSGLKAYESFGVVEKERRPDETHAQALLRHYCALPLVYPTRSKVLYSCLNMQVMAAAAQSVAGQSLEELLRARLWGPLGMKDTTYRPTPAQVARCAPTGVRPDGTPVRGETHDPLAHYHQADTTCPGNAGLFSTAPDLSRYAEMVLAGGTWHGRRVMAPATVALTTSVQTPPDVRTLRGLGWEVYSRPPYATVIGGSPDILSFGHTGYTGTWIWLDKASRTYIVFLTNRVFPSPATKGGEGAAIGALQRDICRTVVASLPAFRHGPPPPPW